MQREIIEKENEFTPVSHQATPQKGLTPYQYYLSYLDLNQKFPSKIKNFKDLQAACLHLAIAVIENLSEAKELLQAIIGAETLATHLEKLMNQIYYARLREIPKESVLYRQAQVEIFGLLYCKRYSHTYSGFQDRFDDLEAALSALHCYQVLPESIRLSASRMLLAEISGEKEPIPSGVSNILNYPFRIQPLDHAFPLVSQGIDLVESDLAIKTLVAKGTQFIAENFTLINASENKSNGYTLPDISPQLAKGKSIIVFMNPKTGNEVARVIFSDDSLKIIGYGANLRIKLADNLSFSNYFFDNPFGEIRFFQKNNHLYSCRFEINAKKFIYEGLLNDNDSRSDIFPSFGYIRKSANGKLERRKAVAPDEKMNAQKIQFIVYGSLIIGKQSGLYAYNMDIRAENLSIKGILRVTKALSLKVVKELEIPLGGIIFSEDSCCIIVGLIKELRGKINARKFEIRSQDGIYLHGAAAVSGKEGIIDARTIHATDKSKILMDGALRVKVSGKIIIDKESRWKGKIVVVTAGQVKNYHEIIGSEYLETNVGEFDNRSSGLLKSNGLVKLNGNNFWNSGKINSDLGIIFSLNQLCFHGMSSCENFVSAIKNVTLPSYQAPTISVSAGVFINILGKITCQAYSLNSILEIDFGILKANYINRSRLISLDYSVEIPNFEAMIENFTHFCQLVKEGNTEAIYNETFTLKNLITLISATRWAARNFTVGLSKIIDVVWTAIMLLIRVPSLYRQAQALLQKGSKIEARDLYPLIGTLSSLENQIYSLVIQTEGRQQVEELLSGHTKDLPPISIVHPERPEFLLLADLATLFAPMSCHDSFGAVEGGIHLTGTVIDRSMCLEQLGQIEGGLSISDIYYQSIQGSSVKAAPNISELGQDLDFKQSQHVFAGQYFATVQDQKIAGSVHASSQADLSGDRVVTAKTSLINAGQALLNGQEIDHQGEIDAKTVNFHADHQLELTESATTIAEKVIGSGENIIQNSHVHIQPNKPGDNPDFVLTAAQNLNIGSSSQADGDQAVVWLEAKQVTDNGKFEVKEIYEKGEILERDPQSHIKAEHVELHAPHLTNAGVIDGVDKEGSPLPLDPKAPIKPDVLLDGDGVTLTADSQIDGGDQEIIAILGNHVSDSGGAKGKMVLEQAKNLELAETTRQQADTIDIEADSAQMNHARLGAKELNYKVSHTPDAESLLTHSGQYDHFNISDNLYVKTDDVVNLGDHDGDFAQNISLEAPGVNLNANILHSKFNLGIFVKNDFTVKRNQKVLSDKELIIKTQGNYFNAGIVQAEVTGIYFGEKATNWGTTQGFHRLDMIGEGDIENLCQEEDYSGLYDTMKRYTPAHFLGGDGVGYDGVGLDMRTRHRIINSGSEISSIGDNHISADEGLESKALDHRYVRSREDDETWWGEETEEWDVDTQVQKALIYSVNGQNNIYSKNGLIYGCSTDFTAAKGTSIYTPNNNVLLTGLVTEREHYESNSWICWESEEDTHVSDAIPTRLMDLTGIEIKCIDANFDDAQIVTPGLLRVTAKNMTVRAPILNYSYDDDETGINAEPGSWSQLNFVNVAQDAKALAGSQNGMQSSLNSMNLAIDSANAMNSALGSLRAGRPVSAFIPSNMTVGTLDFFHRNGSVHGQRIGPAGIHCGRMDLEIENTLTFDHSSSVEVDGSAKIRASHFNQNGYAVQVSSDSDSQEIGLGLQLDGRLYARGGFSHSHSDSVQYVPQIFTVGGQADIVVGDWSMDCAENKFGSLVGHTDHLTMISEKDSVTSDGLGIQADSKGSFDIHGSKRRSSWIGSLTRMDIAGDADFSVENGELKGSVITVGGRNNLHFDSLETQTIFESNRGVSWGISGTISDPSSSDQAIPIFSIRNSGNDDRAIQTSYVGPKMDESPSHPIGFIVTHHEQYDYEAKIPLYNKRGLEHFADNLEWAYQKVFAQKPTEPQDSLITVNYHQSRGNHRPPDQETGKPSSQSRVSNQSRVSSAPSFFNNQLVANYLTPFLEVKTPEDSKRNHPITARSYLSAAARGAWSGAEDSLLTPYHFVRDVVVLGDRALGDRSLFDEGDYLTSSNRMNDRINRMRQFSHLIDDADLYVKVWFINLLPDPTMKQIGMGLERSPAFLEAKEDLQNVGENIQINYEEFMNSSPEEKTETSSRLAAEFLTPYGIVKAGSMILNYYRFDMISNPPLFYNNSMENLIDPPPLMDLQTVESIRATSGEHDYLFVILQNGRLLIAPDKLPRGPNDEKLFPWSAGSHAELAHFNPVISAGIFSTQDGMGQKITPFSGHYRPQGDWIEALTERSFRRHGFNEAKQIFETHEFISDPLDDGFTPKPANDSDRIDTLMQPVSDGSLLYIPSLLNILINHFPDAKTPTPSIQLNPPSRYNFFKPVPQSNFSISPELREVQLYDDDRQAAIDSSLNLLY